MGRVAGRFGVRGWVRVTPWSEDPAALLGHPVWWLRRPCTGEDWQQMEVVSARPHTASLVAELRGVASREAAMALRGFEIGLPRDALAAPGKEQHYWFDLEGMEVVNRAGLPLGRVSEVTAHGAHAILHVVAAGAAERLIPFVPAYIDCVDADARRIDVDWEPDY